MVCFMFAKNEGEINQGCKNTYCRRHTKGAQNDKS